MDNPRFIDNGDGTVTLPALGLMFTKATVTPECVTHTQAEAACAELRTAGHDDWRLPSTHELFALVDHSRFDPAIDTAFFPETQNDWYWTSTVCAWSSARAWFVHFYLGLCSYDGRGDSYGLVRAVRSLTPAETEARATATGRKNCSSSTSETTMTDITKAIAAAREALAAYRRNSTRHYIDEALEDVLTALDAAQGEAVAWCHPEDLEDVKEDGYAHVLAFPGPKEGKSRVPLYLAPQAQPAAVANVTPLRQPRADLARLADAISAAVYDNAKGLSVTEAIGALELAKLELLKEQEQ